MTAAPAAPASGSPGLARRLGLADATLLVMGGIVGSGIFINPYVVARQVGTPALILGAWALGGLIALAGACGASSRQYRANVIATAAIPPLWVTSSRTQP